LAAIFYAFLTFPKTTAGENRLTKMVLPCWVARGAEAMMRFPWIRRFLGDRRANVAIIFGILSPVLIGGAALGFETSYWYVGQRNLQNAADAAVLAAATNASSNYDTEASAVAAQYGYTNGTNNVTVTSSNAATCPTGTTGTCYSVTISEKVQLYMMQVVGYQGNTTVGGAPGVTLAATAIAVQGTQPRNYCLLALGTVGTALLGNGSPKANFSGCSVMSDANATCHGGDLLADYGDAHLTSNNCGVVPESNIPLVSDPYSGLASNIPNNTCSSYPQEPSKHNDPALPSSNLWTGSKSLSGNVQVCGDLQLTGNVTIDAPSNAVLVIENGQLDTNGYTIQTTSGSGVTIVFSGTANSGSTHGPTGGGTLDIAAPTTGNWKGVALYQDPNLTDGVDLSAAGNSPTWDITGLVYLPNSAVTFSGAVNKSSNGSSCFAMVVKDITINGTADIWAHGGCAGAGLTMPTGQAPGRGQLVL
jgi:Flp pilus assembly protein TadG